MKIGGLFLVILVISLAGCVTEEKEDTQVSISTTPHVSKETTKPAFSSEITTLLAKGTATTNYHYSFQGLVRNSYGNYDQTSVSDISVRDDLQKKSWISAKEYKNNIFYDQIYLDSDARTAIAVCSSVSAVSCAELQNKAFKMDFASQEIIYLNQLVTNLPADTKKIGEESINNRDCIIIEYAKGKYKEKLSIDKFYGLPLQRILYTMENEETIELEKDRYDIVSVDNVKTSDVTLPNKYSLD